MKSALSYAGVENKYKYRVLKWEQMSVEEPIEPRHYQNKFI